MGYSLIKREAKMAKISAKFFFLFMDQDGVEFHKHAKRKELNIWPSYPHAWSIKDLQYGIRNKFLL